VRYDDLVRGTREEAHGRAVARFSRDPGKVASSVNPEVVREYQLNLKALAQEKAISLSDTGRPEAAVQTLRESASKLKEVGDAHRDPGLLRQADELERQAESIESDGMTSRNRKVLRTKSYQMKNQQSSE
jgi:Ca-activated chloride channel family protein